MKFYKAFLLAAFLFPFLAMPIDIYFSASNEGAVVLTENINDNWVAGDNWIDWTNGVEYTTAVFGDKVWMTKNFKASNTLMTYKEAEAMAPKGWRLPCTQEWKELFTELGFGQHANQLIPASYYRFNFESEGHADPIVGANDKNEQGVYWVASSEDESQYMAIPHQELSYKEGKISSSALLAVRYIKE